MFDLVCLFGAETICKARRSKRFHLTLYEKRANESLSLSSFDKYLDVSFQKRIQREHFDDLSNQ